MSKIQANDMKYCDGIYEVDVKNIAFDEQSLEIMNEYFQIRNGYSVQEIVDGQKGDFRIIIQCVMTEGLSAITQYLKNRENLSEQIQELKQRIFGLEVKNQIRALQNKYGMEAVKFEFEKAGFYEKLHEFLESDLS